MTWRLASVEVLREDRCGTAAACLLAVPQLGKKDVAMNSFRFGSLLLAVALVACHERPIRIAPATVPPPAPSRPLLDTPLPAVVPTPPIPELKPGTGFTLTVVPPHTLTAVVTAPTVAPPHTLTASITAPADANNGGLAAAPTAAPAAGGTSGIAPASASLTDTDPSSLVGLSEADAVRRFGVPSSHTDTPPSRIWTYHSVICDLRLFFYPEVGGSAFRTLTYEIDDHDPADTTRRGCVGGLLKNHAG